MPLHETLEQAIARIEAHHRVLVPPACGLPQALVAELGRQAARFRKLQVMGGYLIGSAPYVEEAFASSFHYTTIHPVGDAAKALARGQATYVPMRYFDTLRFFARGGPLAADVVLVQTAPPDAQGRFSLGVSPSYPLPLAKTAPLVIAQVNRNMPRTLGHGFLDPEDIDVVVEYDEPVREHRVALQGPTEMRIAEQIATLIADGSTVQTGLGAIPEALLEKLTNKRNLRLHGLLVPSARALFDSGAVSGSPEDTRICEIMGDQALFRWAHENPAIFMEDSTVVHDPVAIAQIPKFVCVISAVEVDLTGQVNAEALGTRAVGGIGGQLDFAMGAKLSRDGMTVLALPSTSGKNGEFSRIVSTLSSGAPVTTPRSLVDFVVTEHGIADLRGKSLGARKEALVAVACPRFRDALKRAQ